MVLTEFTDVLSFWVYFSAFDESFTGGGKEMEDTTVRDSSILTGISTPGRSQGKSPETHTSSNSCTKLDTKRSWIMSGTISVNVKFKAFHQFKTNYGYFAHNYIN